MSAAVTLTPAEQRQAEAYSRIGSLETELKLATDALVTANAQIAYLKALILDEVTTLENASIAYPGSPLADIVDGAVQRLADGRYGGPR